MKESKEMKNKVRQIVKEELVSEWQEKYSAADRLEKDSQDRMDADIARRNPKNQSTEVVKEVAFSLDNLFKRGFSLEDIQFGFNTWLRQKAELRESEVANPENIEPMQEKVIKEGGGTEVEINNRTYRVVDDTNRVYVEDDGQYGTVLNFSFRDDLFYFLQALQAAYDEVWGDVIDPKKLPGEHQMEEGKIFQESRTGGLKFDLKLKDGSSFPVGTKIEKTEFPNDNPRMVLVTLDGRSESIKMSVARAYKYLPGFHKPPSERQLEKFASDSVVTTPTGKRVEPDGRGDDGSPSWLLVLGVI